MKQLEYMTEPELRTFMNGCATAIVGEALHQDVEKPQFVLLLFNDPKLGQYVSNCNRQDIIKALRETADRLERGEDVPR